MKKLFHFAFLIFLIVFLILPASAYYKLETPQGFVLDNAEMISEAVQTELETKLANYEKDTNHEIAVVTINSLDGDTIENFANLLFNDWGIGKKNADNGILFLIAKDDRKMRIEVGYGLEGAVTDIESKYILDRYVTPLFKADDFDGGITKGVDLIMQAGQEEIVPDDYSSKAGTAQTNIAIILAFSAFFIVFPWLAAVLGRTKRWWPGGIVGAVIGVIIFLISSIIIIIPIYILIGLIFDYLVSKEYKKAKTSGKTPSWWAGGSGSSWGGSSSGGSSGGGFGGGSSGGGGASGGW